MKYDIGQEVFVRTLMVIEGVERSVDGDIVYLLEWQSSAGTILSARVLESMLFPLEEPKEE